MGTASGTATSDALIAIRRIPTAGLDPNWRGSTIGAYRASGRRRLLGPASVVLWSFKLRETGWRRRCDSLHGTSGVYVVYRHRLCLSAALLRLRRLTRRECLAGRRSGLREVDPEGKNRREHSSGNRGLQRGPSDLDGLSSG